MFLEAKNRECVCKAFVCNSGNCGKALRFVYNNSWKWVEAYPNNQVPTNFCCSDTDCSGYDPLSHLKLVCDCPSASCSYPNPPTGTDDYRCKPLPKCDINEQCAPNWCCTADPALPAECKDAIGSCVNEGNMRCNNRYLCDPPEWSNEKTLDEKQTNNFLI